MCVWEGWRRKEPQCGRCPQVSPAVPTASPDISPACTQHAGTRLGSFSIFYFLKVDNLCLSYHTNSSSLCTSLKVLGCDSAHRSGTHGYRTKAEREGDLARAPTVPSLSAAAGYLHVVLGQGPFPVAGATGPGAGRARTWGPSRASLRLQHWLSLHRSCSRSQPISGARYAGATLPISPFPLPLLAKPQIIYSLNTKTFSYCSFASRRRTFFKYITFIFLK